MTPFSTYPRLLQLDQKKDSENVGVSTRIQKTGTFISLFKYIYIYRRVFVYTSIFFFCPDFFILRGKCITQNRYINSPLFGFTRTHTAKALSKKMSDCGSLGYRLGYQRQKG